MPLTAGLDPAASSQEPKALASSHDSKATLSVFFVRHGERKDEVSFGSWFQNALREQRHDPPITERGKLDAHAHALSVLVNPHSVAPFQRIYSSPFRRCVETAAQLARALHVPVQIVMGLGHCAKSAEDHKGVHNLKFDPVSVFAHEYPDVSFLETDNRTDIVDFLEVSARIAEEHLEQQQRGDPAAVATLSASLATALSLSPSHTQATEVADISAGQQVAHAALTTHAEGGATKAMPAAASEPAHASAAHGTSHPSPPAQAPRILIVGHREGIRALVQQRKYRRIPYCGTVHTAYSSPANWVVDTIHFKPS